MNLLLDHFFDAVQTNNDVEKLKQKILDLAIRGQLVEQDTTEEAAAVLLKNIKKEKKLKPENLVIKETSPFELPQGWEWCYLGDLGVTQTGATPPTSKKEYFAGDIPFINPGDISPTGINYHNKTLSEIGVSIGRKIEKNSVLMVCIGGSIGKCFYNDRVVSCNQQINTITGLGGICNVFLFYFMSSDYFFQNVIERSTGSATPIINKRKWENILFPLPPLKEQQRIIAKVDELFAICDELAKQIVQEKEALAILNKTVFTSFQSESSEEADQAIQFAIDHMDELLETKEDVYSLKSGILSLAMQGKLVPQDFNEESASELLVRIQEEKKRLIKEKMISKADKPVPIEENEKPYKIPKNWEWVRLGEITNYGYPKKADTKLINEKTWVLELEDIEKNSSKLLKKILYKNRKFTSSKNTFSPNDVLYGKLRPYLNKVIVAKEEGVCSSEIMPFRGYDNISASFLKYYLKSPEFIKYVNKKMYGMKMPRLGTKDARKAVMPLPPLNEQRRITSKIECLFEACDRLEDAIENASKKQNLLMKTTL